MMMKSDVLSGIKTIKVCTHYISNNTEIDYLPFEDNSDLKPVYKELKGWDMNLMDLENLSDALKKFMSILHILENELKIPIKIISVGPDRKQTFFR